MSIGRRFINVAKAELNSLLDYASKHVDDDDDGSSTADDTSGLSGVSAREMEEELERRRRAHEEVEEAIHGRRSTEAPPAGKASSSSRGKERQGSDTVAGDALKLQKAYATLEVPAGSNFDTVRKSYRALMRKYHPDHHTETPEKQRAANEVAQKLTDAYKFLQKKLER